MDGIPFDRIVLGPTSRVRALLSYCARPPPRTLAATDGSFTRRHSQEAGNADTCEWD